MRFILFIQFILLTGCATSDFGAFHYTGDPHTNDAVVDGIPVRFAGGTVYDRYLSLREGVLGFHAVNPFHHGSAQVRGIRIQAVHSHNSESYRQRVQLKISGDTLRHYPESFAFLMIWEMWNDPSWGDYEYPFRLNLSLQKPEPGESDLHWLVSAQQWDGKFIQVWRYTSEQPVRFGEWMALDIKVIEGNPGLFEFKVDGQTIFKVEEITHSPAGNTPGITYVHPMKLYTFSELVEFTPLTLYWKNLRISSR